MNADEQGWGVAGQWPATTGKLPVPPRLSVSIVERLHRTVGGDARVEDMILRFIADRYGATNLLELHPKIAKAILQRPADFIHAAKEFCEPTLRF